MEPAKEYAHEIEVSLSTGGVAGLAVANQVIASEGGAPPPPVVDSVQWVIPKAVRLHFLTIIHPGYVHWIGGSNGMTDSIAAFQMYLAMQPMTRFERSCYCWLYTELNAGH